MLNENCLDLVVFKIQNKNRPDEGQLRATSDTLN